MQKNKKKLSLINGSEIGIVGGGPAGSLFAIYAFEYATKLGVDVKVTIFNNRDFLEPGPRGCKGCVGVINERLNHELKENGIELPGQYIMQTIDGYCFVTKGGDLYVKKRTELDEIITLFRGNGPLCSPLDGGFDSYLLEHAVRSGANVIQSTVREVIFPENKDEKIKVIYDGVSHEMDLLIGAFGIKSNLTEKFKEIGYIPPDITRSCLLEIKCNEEHIQKFIKNTIYIYSFGIPGIDYGIMIPKKKFLTVAMVGKEVKPSDLREFLSNPLIAKMIPQDPDICCRCCTLIPVSNAKHPFSDRVLIIGDAGYSRYYKNGLESAFFSSRIAVRSVFDHGIAKEDFENYYLPLCKKIFIDENFYGRMLFRLNSIISSHEILSMAHMDIARKDERKGHHHLDDIQWNMFTGHDSYKNIFWKFFEPRLQMELFIEIIKEFLERLRKKCHLK